VTPLRERPAWVALESHNDAIRDTHLRDLFAADPTRGERLVAEGAGIYLDYSKNRVTDDTLALLLQLAEESDLRERTEAMFRGEFADRVHPGVKGKRGEARAGAADFGNARRNLRLY